MTRTMQRAKTKTTHGKTRQTKHSSHDERRPFIEHVHELRRRIMYVALSIGGWACVAYGVEHYIVKALLKPAHDQQFIYTSPGGGIDFLFRVCLYTGIAMSIPVIVYQILRYAQPLIKAESTRFIALGSIISAILAVIGMAYGYFWGLPAALEFLLNQFVTKQIQPLVTIQSYMSFVMVYMLGSAMLLQVPLILIFINRIRPIKPQRLLKYERHVIVAAVVIAALMNPTPNIFALAFIALPIILMYQVGIFIIWWTNRKHAPRVHPAHVLDLIEQDMARQAERLQLARQARQLQPAYASASTMTPMAVVPQPTAAARTPGRPYVSRPVRTRPARRRMVQ